MARQGYKRWFNTRYWNDSFVADLDPVEKLLFIYFLTNEHTNIAGIYELPLKVIAMETGFEITMVKKIFGRLKDKVRHINGRVVVRNWLKHQSYESSDTRTGILNVLKGLDQVWLGKLLEKKLYHIPEDLRGTQEGAYRVPIGSPRYSDSDTDSDTNTDKKGEAPLVPSPFVLKDEIAKMEEDKKRHIQIIGLYFKQKKPDIRTKEQMKTAISRHVKAAMALAPFDDDQILKGFRKASEFGEWTIETAIKHLTK